MGINGSLLRLNYNFIWPNDKVRSSAQLAKREAPDDGVGEL